MACWQPLDTVLWRVESEIGQALALVLFGAGVSLVLYATLLIDHFVLFGLRQVIDHDSTTANKLRKDPGFESLHGSPEFEALLDDVKRRTEASR